MICPGDFKQPSARSGLVLLDTLALLWNGPTLPTHAFTYVCYMWSLHQSDSHPHHYGSIPPGNGDIIPPLPGINRKKHTEHVQVW